MTSLHLFLLILLMRVAHFSYIVTSIITYATFNVKFSLTLSNLGCVSRALTTLVMVK